MQKSANDGELFLGRKVIATSTLFFTCRILAFSWVDKDQQLAQIDFEDGDWSLPDENCCLC